MTWVVPLALGGLAVLVMAVFTMLSARKRHHAMVQPAQVGGPRILIHDINDDRCTGCDACVAVCPTNVLDLVANKSRVLRFQDCIQCEACMFACPTEALVMFPEGGTPPPLKIPEIDENFQTAVPGQYLIGEVAGKPLVKNAANLGRAVIEHMLVTGMYPGALGRSETVVDVVIVGSGPGGLSAALSCIQKGLSYVVLEKEQQIASTIARYPKGKLVMAEPYDTQNLSLLPVFDSAKEQLIPIWRELLDRVGVRVRQGESVESVQRGPDGAFDIRTTVGAYRAQRVVLSIGTRGKPRTLQVQGENLPKVYSLLEDPDEWRGRAVLVVGGGDSACEAALALADAGAKVMISYRGKGFNRAAPKNKQTIEQYAAEGRIKAKLGSQVVNFEPDAVTLALGDGSQKRYPNDGAFVLIGADPPIAWLEKMGVRFVERPHQHQMGKSDDILRRFAPYAIDCPEDAARAASQILGGSVGLPPAAAAIGLGMPPQPAPPVSGPRKWLRSATSIFSSKAHTPPPARAVRPPTAPPPMPGLTPPPAAAAAAARGKKFEAPVPLSEFAKRGKSQGGFINASTHSGHGRRDQLTSGERTRILRMLRDEGGRLADEDSQVFIGAPPAQSFDFDFEDDSPAHPPSMAPPAPPRLDVPAKPAVVVGLAQAQASKSRGKRPTVQPPQPARRPVPAPFNEEPTRQVNDQILRDVRNPPPSPASSSRPPALVPQRPAPSGKPLPPPSREPFGQEPTRMANIDARALDNDAFDQPATILDPHVQKFLETVPKTEPGVGFPDDLDNQATSLASVDSYAQLERQRRASQPSDERTRAVNIRNDKSMSDIDWDID
ncbi:MAG TPA: NAD(P)-binding domain-containing protein [Kofleriaceae bacterium]|nr:NAD(P)-binding domain-containing protein [Kofleriaceae bacterium]